MVRAQPIEGLNRLLNQPATTNRVLVPYATPTNLQYSNVQRLLQPGDTPLQRILQLAAQVFAEGSSQPASGDMGGGSMDIVRPIKASGEAQRQQRRKDAPEVAVLDMQPVSFSITTFNLRGISDRWPERRDLLQQCLRHTDSDIFCFQEVLSGSFAQDKSLLGPTYTVHSCPAALRCLLQQGGAGAMLANMVNSLAKSRWFGAWLRQLPLQLEQYREAYRLQSDIVRLARDVCSIPWFGNSLATRLPTATEEAHDVLVLGDFRAAQRLLVRVPTPQQEGPLEGPSGAPSAGRASKKGTKSAGKQQNAKGAPGGPSEGPTEGPVTDPLHVWIVNVHLDHDHPDRRARQGEQVVGWMESVKGLCDAIILCGDFNASPEEPLHRLLRQQQYRSAYSAVHGHEPKGTWPSGIEAPFAEHGAFECLDYCYVWEGPGVTCRVASAEIKGASPSPSDPTLYPSDHLGLKIMLELQRQSVECQHVVV